MITKKWFIILVLISLLFFQLIHNFLFPSVGFTDNWQPISQYLPKFEAGAADNFVLEKIYPLISSGYRLNSDSGHYLELGRNFSAEYFQGSPFLERPLYPFLIFLFSLPLRLFADLSYGIIFGLSIIVNFILMSIGVLLFFSLLKELFSLKVAWLSSILLIFSPFVRSFLNQPLAEMLMIFAVILAGYLLFNYVKKPSVFKLIFFSFAIGILMLGKMFFAISFFILILAIYSKRYKEGAVFLAFHLIPLLLWYLWITGVWQIDYYSHGTEHYRMGTWIFDMVNWSRQEIFRVLFEAIPNFIIVLVSSFLLFPIIFSLIGFQKMPLRAKNIVYFGSLASVLMLGFLTRFYYLRHVFLLFPIIYPTAVLGIERVARRPIFQVIIIGIIILISSIDIFQVFDYYDYKLP